MITIVSSKGYSSNDENVFSLNVSFNLHAMMDRPTIGSLREGSAVENKVIYATLQGNQNMTRCRNALDHGGFITTRHTKNAGWSNCNYIDDDYWYRYDAEELGSPSLLKDLMDKIDKSILSDIKITYGFTMIGRADVACSLETKKLAYERMLNYEEILKDIYVKQVVLGKFSKVLAQKTIYFDNVVLEDGECIRACDVDCRGETRKVINNIFSNKWYESGMLRDATIIYESASADEVGAQGTLTIFKPVEIGLTMRNVCMHGSDVAISPVFALMPIMTLEEFPLIFWNKCIAVDTEVLCRTTAKKSSSSGLDMTINMCSNDDEWDDVIIRKLLIKINDNISEHFISGDCWVGDIIGVRENQTYHTVHHSKYHLNCTISQALFMGAATGRDALDIQLNGIPNIHKTSGCCLGHVMQLNKGARSVPNKDTRAVWVKDSGSLYKRIGGVYPEYCATTYSPNHLEVKNPHKQKFSFD